MKHFLLFAITVTGCVATSEPTDEADQAASTTRWEAALHCGNGGVVVDVDRDERRNLQAVVRDAGAVSWLASHPGDGGAGTPNARHEIILRGTVVHGVFAPADFTSLSQLGFAAGDALTPEAHVARDGAGLRVRLVTWASGQEVETANWWFADCR